MHHTLYVKEKLLGCLFSPLLLFANDGASGKSGIILHVYK